MINGKTKLQPRQAASRSTRNNVWYEPMVTQSNIAVLEVLLSGLNGQVNRENLVMLKVKTHIY